MAWEAILEGEPAQRARQEAVEIAGAIRDRLSAADAAAEMPASLYSGFAGSAVTLGQAYRVLGDRAWAEAMVSALELAQDELEATPLGSSLGGGLSGIAWAFEHLDADLRTLDGDDEEGDDEEEDGNEEVDDALADLLRGGAAGLPYDLVGGLVGIGVYALERLPRPSGATLLASTVELLERRAEVTEAGLTWRTPPEHLEPEGRREHPAGWYNLGLAHGVAGVVALLAGACAAGVASPAAQRLLDGAVRWMLAQRLAGASPLSFPYWIADGRPTGPSRLAWCYGDLGIAVALALAGRATGVEEWTRTAGEVALMAAGCPAGESGVVDAGFCHGAAGAAHLLNRLYQVTGQEPLAAAARDWMERTLGYKLPDRGVAGYQALRFEEHAVWEDDASLLTGAAGVALCYLAAASAVEPTWDRMVLLST